MHENLYTQPLDQVIRYLAYRPTLESSILSIPNWAKGVFDQATRTSSLAFEAQDPAALLTCHRTLKILYDLHLFPNGRGSENQYNPFLGQVRQTLEDGWMDAEQKRTKIDPTDIPNGKSEFADYFQKWVLSHPTANHKLYDYLEKDATRDDMFTFFRDEHPLDVRFFDIIVLAAIGTDGSVRSEVSQNMWDESGNGQEEIAHTTLYRKLVTQLGITETDDQFADQMGVEALAGYNLFQYLGQNRSKYIESIGALGATELLDPPLYTKFMNGAGRLGLDNETNLHYYSEHIAIDIFHGEGWINRVMLPIMDQAPDAAVRFIRGAEMRLHTAGDYYDSMYSKLTKESNYA